MTASARDGEGPRTHGFDQDYWEEHWRRAHGAGEGSPPNPYLERELTGVVPGTALDAGCGEGAEARWLAAHGWQVTAADISSGALAHATDRAAASRTAGVQWVEADLGVWEPGRQFDLVTTHYAHPAMPQLEFYDRIASWVAPAGTLLIVGHLHHPERVSTAQHGHGEPEPPASASVTAVDITARLDPAVWEIVTAEESHRAMGGHDGQGVSVADVVIRAVRRQ
jgi:SAM-dependent methyltransferase